MRCPVAATWLFCTVTVSTVIIFCADAATVYPDRGVLANEQFVYDIQVADVEGDGDVDVWVGAQDLSGHVILSRNNGDGTFDSEMVVFPNRLDVRGLAVADFDGDGHLDWPLLIVTEQEEIQPSLLS